MTKTSGARAMTRTSDPLLPCDCMNGTCPHDINCAVHTGPVEIITRSCDCSLNTMNSSLSLTPAQHHTREVLHYMKDVPSDTGFDSPERQDISWITEALACTPDRSRLTLAHDLLMWLNSFGAMTTVDRRNIGAGLIRMTIAAVVDDNLGGHEDTPGS